MTKRITTFYIEDDVYQKFKSILEKERTPYSQKVEEIMQDFIKKHGDGNPAFTLDQFQDPDFKVCPAFFRDSKTWQNYLESIIANPKEWQEFDYQLNHLLNLSNKIFRKK